ncbi:MAG: double zinc ribbon domain-containing protein [Mariprofundus sp.]
MRESTMSGMLVGMNMLSTKGIKMVNRLGGLLFPPACIFCHVPMSFGKGCCTACLENIEVWPHSACRRCGIPLPADMQPGPCGHCLQKPPAQHQTCSLYCYHGAVRDAILEWKLHGHDTGVRWLVDAAMPRLQNSLNEHSLLLPIPMPLSRMRKSGQHHTANLCKWLADGTECLWDWQLLRRIGEQPRQSALSGQARRKNLRKAFALADDYASRWQDLADRVTTIWIVDDILTTGSTLHFAARASLMLGVPINVLSLARTSLKG